MTSGLVELLQLGVAGFVLVILMVELARRPIALVAVYLAVYAWSLIASIPQMNVVGIWVSPIDAVNVVALGAAAIRLRRGPKGWQWGLVVAVLLIVYATLRGMIQLGDSALLGFRLELYFVVPALFVSTLPSASAAKIVRLVVGYGGVLALVAVGRWVVLALGAGGGALMGGGDYAIDRVINAFTTLWVAFAGIVGTVALLDGTIPRRRWSPWAIWMWTLVTLAVVVLAQHRSVWVATAVMLAVAFVATRSRWLAKAAVVVVLGAGVVSIEVAGLGDAGPVGESLAFAASNTQTWEWRLERWTNVWSTHAARGVEAIVLGSGYGYGWVTGVVGTWEVSPHNGFLQIAVRIGLLGAFLVFAPYAIALRRLRNREGPVARVLWLWVIGTLVFYIPYGGNMLTGVLLGATIAFSASRSTSVAEHVPQAVRVRSWPPHEPVRQVGPGS